MSPRRRGSRRTARQLGFLLVLLLGLAGLFKTGGCSSAPPEAPAVAGPAQVGPAQTGRVVHVVDGDTVRLESGAKVRYIGIDTPEKGEPFSRESTEFNRSLTQGRSVRLEYDKEPKDRYGRLLAYVYVDRDGREVCVNEETIRNGLATYYEVGSNRALRDELVAAQRDARRDGLGLWSVPRAGREAADHYVASSRRFHRPSCKSVRSIRKPVMFDARGDGFDRGLSPCRQCKP